MKHKEEGKGEIASKRMKREKKKEEKRQENDSAPAPSDRFARSAIAIKIKYHVVVVWGKRGERAFLCVGCALLCAGPGVRR